MTQLSNSRIFFIGGLAVKLESTHPELTVEMLGKGAAMIGADGKARD
eukprot:SAG31_NODE_17853_length_655_cov_2.102518_1_plen_46_part_10